MIYVHETKCIGSYLIKHIDYMKVTYCEVRCWLADNLLFFGRGIGLGIRAGGEESTHVCLPQ